MPRGRRDTLLNKDTISESSSRRQWKSRGLIWPGAHTWRPEEQRDSHSPVNRLSGRMSRVMVLLKTAVEIQPVFGAACARPRIENHAAGTTKISHGMTATITVIREAVLSAR